MALYVYHGFDRAGAKLKGSIDAQSPLEAAEQLKRQGILVKSIKEDKSAGLFSLNRAGKVSLSDLEFLTTELSLLLESGLRIDKAVLLLSENSRNAALSQLLNSLSKELRSGKQFSQALSSRRDVFDDLYINLVGIGEATGKLAYVFKQLSENLTEKKALRQKISQALSYPTVILFVCIASLVFILNYVVPNMSGLFEGQINLPLYTQLLLSLSSWMQSYQWYLAFVIVALITFVPQLLKRPDIREKWQGLSLNLPLVKSAILMVERIRFNSGLSMMLHAGVSLDTALTLATGNLKMKSLRKELDIAVVKIKKGESLSGSLGQTQLYSNFFASLLAVGEESGELGKIFSEITQRSQREFSNWVTLMTTLLEPLLILFMGAIVGGVVVIMMLSVTSVTDMGF